MIWWQQIKTAHILPLVELGFLNTQMLIEWKGAGKNRPLLLNNYLIV